MNQTPLDFPDSVLFEGAGGFHNQITGWWKDASDEDRECLADRALIYWRKRGFPYPEVTDQFIREYLGRLVNVDADKMLLPGDIVKNTSVGVTVPNAYHKHRWGIKCSHFKTVIEAWADDKHLKRIAKAAFRMAGVASDTIMRSMASTSLTQTVANFLPAVARMIYHFFTGSGGVILDPSAGYGGRAFGVAGLHRRHYWGIDPAAKTIAGNVTMVEDLHRLRLITSDINFLQGGAEQIMPMLQSEMFDCIFTSPPYFDVEKYDDINPNQSYSKFPEYDGWLNGFLRVILRHSRRLIKPGGHVCYNIGNVRDHETQQDLVRIAREEGLNLKHLFQMRMGLRPTARDRSIPYRFEPIFILQRDVDYPHAEPTFFRPPTASDDSMKLFS